jgi:hypothetical protein
VRGARTLRTTGPCSELTPSLALTISLAIDPMAFSRRGRPEGLPPSERPVEAGDAATTIPPPPPPQREDTQPPDEPAEQPAEPQRLRMSAGAGAIGSIGSAPAPALGLLLFGDARLGAFGAILEARADLPSGTDADVPGRVSSSLLAATVAPCAWRGVVFACVRGTIGRISAEGLDVTKPGASSAFWAAAGGRLGGDLPIGGIFRVRVHGDLDAVLTRYVLKIGGEIAFRYAPVAGGLGIALGATLR